MGTFTNKLVRAKQPTVEWGPWVKHLGAAGHPRAPHGLIAAWRNSVYSVQWVDRNRLEVLMVRRHDARPSFPWRDLQRIKDELAGPHREAVQVFPRRSEIVDVANMAHLWLVPADARLPYTFQNLGPEGNDRT